MTPRGPRRPRLSRRKSNPRGCEKMLRPAAACARTRAGAMPVLRRASCSSSSTTSASWRSAFPCKISARSCRVQQMCNIAGELPSQPQSSFNARAPPPRGTAVPSMRARGSTGNASGPDASGDPAEAASIARKCKRRALQLHAMRSSASQARFSDSPEHARAPR